MIGVLTGILASGGKNMAEFKVVIADPKTGKCYQKEVKEDAAKPFMGLKIGDTVKGELMDMTGYEFVLTGGSDYAGFPMRKDVDGQMRKRIVTVKGVGVHNTKRKPNPKKKGIRVMKGMRQKKTVAGNTIFAQTAQLNLKVLKYGKESLDPKPEAPAEDTKPAEKKE